MEALAALFYAAATGVLLQVVGVALIAAAPLLLLLPPDYATGMESAGVVVLGIAGVLSLLLGRVLARRWATFRELAGMLGTMLFGAACLLGARLYAGRVPAARALGVSLSRAWQQGRTFRYRSEVVFGRLQLDAEHPSAVQYRLKLDGRGEVLRVGTDGWPLAVSYRLERLIADLGGAERVCRDVAVTMDALGDVRVLDPCASALQAMLSSALLPNRPPPVDDAKVEARTRCGWPSCLVIARSASGDVARAYGGDEQAYLQGRFEQRTRMYLPVRPELVSFGLSEVLDDRLHAQAGAPWTSSHRLVVLREVSAMGDNAVFDELAPLAHLP